MRGEGVLWTECGWTRSVRGEVVRGEGVLVTKCGWTGSVSVRWCDYCTIRFD